MALKHTVTAYVLLMTAHVVLSLGPVRRFFGLSPRSAQRDTSVIYAGSVLFGLLLWVLDALASFFVFPREGQTFWSLAVHGAGMHEVFMRSIYVVAAVFAGVVLSIINRRRVALQELLDHRNRILSAIRNVNQLIVREKDTNNLLDEACRLLVETQGYYDVWIALTADDRPRIPFYHAGFDGGFSPMTELLSAGDLPVCARTALLANGVQVIIDPAVQCTGCPLASTYDDRAGLSLRLEHAGRVFGWMGLSCSRKYARSADEHDLLEEVAGDIAFALWAIEKEKQRETIAGKYADILASTRDTVIASDMEGLITVFNPGAERLFGCSADEVLGTPLTRFCPEDLLEEQAEVMRRLSEKGSVSGYESERLTTDGRRIPVEVTLSLNTDDLGRPLGFNAIYRDITERKQAEASLRQNHAMLARTERIANLGSWEWDIEADHVRWSEELFRILQRDPSLGAPSFSEHKDIYLAEDMDRLKAAVEACVSKGTPYELELRAIRTDGTIRNCVARGQAEYDATGHIHLLVGSFQDITERKRVEDALRESETRFRFLVDYTYDLIWTLTSDGVLTYASPSWKTRLGHEPSYVIGKGFQQLMHPDDVPGCEAYMSKVLIERKPLPSPQYRVKHANGTWRWHEAAMTPVYDEKGSFIYLVGVSRDITERMRAEQEREQLQAQLTQAQKMEAVGRLAGGVAHDFNNMLGIIIGHADLLLEQTDPDKPIHADLSEIREAGARSADLTRQLLAFARKQTVAPRVIDLNETVEGILKMLHRLIGEDIEMEWIPCGEMRPVKIDPGQVDQILANLCVNARDAIAGVGRMTIESGTAVIDEAFCRDHAGFLPGEYAVLAVSDNGCGMDSETISHLFEPFFTTKELGKGTGLGLATVYGVVKQNNGFINVCSEPGQGTTFRIYLPCHRARTLPAPEKRPEALKGSVHEIVLLVEDEPAILKMTKRMLEREGYTVVTAGTPGEAIRLAHEHSGDIHLLITDVVMPEMNGRDLARNILTLYPGLKCLFMSGFTADVIAHHGVLDEGVNFIQKPFSMSELTAKLREVLDRDHVG